MFFRTRAINVTTAARSRRNTMNTNTIDSASTGKLEQEVTKTNGKRTPAKKTKKAARAKKTTGNPPADLSYRLLLMDWTLHSSDGRYRFLRSALTAEPYPALRSQMPEALAKFLVPATTPQEPSNAVNQRRAMALSADRNGARSI
jgi:hypothetical protein